MLSLWNLFQLALITFFFMAWLFFHLLKTKDKSRNGIAKDETVVSDLGPSSTVSVSGLSVPQASLHASTSTNTLVVSATTFVRKSSLLRRPKTEIWTVNRENSLWSKHPLTENTNKTTATATTNTQTKTFRKS
jgi:hypothetical protein